MSGSQQPNPHQPVYPSPPLTEMNHQSDTRSPEQNQRPGSRRIQEVPPHLLGKFVEPLQSQQQASGRLPSSVAAAMNHVSHQQQSAQENGHRPSLMNGSNQSPMASLSHGHEQRRYPQNQQHRPSSPTQQTHFSYTSSPAQIHEPATPSEPRPPGQTRTQSEPNVVYREAHHQQGPQTIIVQPPHPQGHHQLPRSHPHHQPHQPGPSTKLPIPEQLKQMQAHQHHMALLRQQELKRLSLASAGALPPPALPSPATAAVKPAPIITGGMPAAAGSQPSAHPDSHTEHTNGASTATLAQTLIHHSAAQALAPVRPIFEQAWLETVTNVQREMGKMVEVFDERIRGLEHDASRLRDERNRGREEISRLGEELRRVGDKCDRYKEERNRLRDELAHYGNVTKNSVRDKEVEVGTLRREVERLRNELDRSRMENEQIKRESDANNMPKAVRRLTEEEYDDVDEGFRLAGSDMEVRAKVNQTPPKDEPSSPAQDTPSQFHLEVAKMKEQLQREMELKMQDILEKGMRSREAESRTTSPVTVRPTSSSPAPVSSGDGTRTSSTRTSPGPSTTLRNAPPGPMADNQNMDIDRDENVPTGSLGSLPPTDVETRFSSLMPINGDQGRHGPHAAHASSTTSASPLTAPVQPTQPHPHSTVAHTSKSLSRPASPTLIQGTLGRRGEGSDVSRDTDMGANSGARPLTPSSPIPSFRSKSTERPGSGLGNRGRSTASTPTVPAQAFTEPSPFVDQGWKRSDSASRSRPATPRVARPNGPGTPPLPPPPSHVSAARLGSSPATSSPSDVQSRTPPQQQHNRSLANPSSSPRTRHTRFSSPIRTSDYRGGENVSDVTARKRGREEFEQEAGRGLSGLGSQHQRANTHPGEERARQRVKVEPVSDDHDRANTNTAREPSSSPSPRVPQPTNSNQSRPVDHRGSWSNIIPSSLPPLQQPAPVDRKPVITSPDGPRPSPNPNIGVRPTIWKVYSTAPDRWASSASGQVQRETRPSSAGSTGDSQGSSKAKVAFPFRKPLTTSLNVNGQQKGSPISPTDGNGPSPTSKNKLGIKHLDLLYETISEKYHCRVCKQPSSRDQSPTTPPVTFPKNAGWPDLAGHYQTAHPKSCEDLEKLSAAQVAELKQQLKSSRFCGFVLS